MTKTIFSLLLIALALPGVGSASVGIDTNINTNVNVQTPVATTSTGASVNASGEVETGDTTSSPGTGQAAAVILGNTLEISGDEVRAGGAATTTITLAEVTSDETLSTYVRGQVQADAAIETVTTTDNSVTVVYNRPARLLAFIPVTLQERAEIVVDNEGGMTVTVRKSWWSFLTTNDVDTAALTTAIESRIEDVTVPANETALSASLKADLVSRITAAATATYGAGTVSE